MRVVPVSEKPNARTSLSIISLVKHSILDSKAVDAGAVLEQQTLYSDSLTYAAQKGILIDSGYKCTAGKSTYSVNFCVNNKNAVNQYLPYYEGDGRYTCSPN